MELVIKIVVECVLVVPLFVLSNMLWSNVKNVRFRRSSLQNGDLLTTLIKQLNNDIPFSQRCADLKPRQGNWVYDLSYHTTAAFQALFIMRTAWAALILALLVGSAFLGWIFLGISVIVLLLGFASVLYSYGQEYALNDIAKIAAVLYCWRRDDPEDYVLYNEGMDSFAALRAAVEQYAS